MLRPVGIEPGTSVGPYLIDRELGRGGMGVVYRGTDTRLDRPVAIKVLPDEVAADPERLGRFEREAKTLAQVTHPGIAGIYGVEREGDTRYIVLEMIEGETLAAQLDRGALPVDEAIEIACQIGAGLAAAHDAGIIHRDLKPANVMITPDGQAKLLDFGLARADDGATTSTGAMEAATVTTPAMHSPTMPGAIMGTAAYMSPEQARGRRIDKRTDIWSFGVVLYEMLTGRSPFQGETVSDSIGAILHMDLDLSALPRGTPETVRHVIRRCTSRDKDQRYRDIGDVRLDLLADGVPADTPVPSGKSRVPTAPIAIGASVFTAVAAGVGVWLASPKPIKETLYLAAPVELASITGGPTQPLRHDVSPDGTEMLYIAPAPGTEGGIGETVVYRRRFDERDPTRIPGADRAFRATYSPSGRNIAFSWPAMDGRDWEWRLVNLDGGPATTLFVGESRYDAYYRPTWLSDDRLVVVGDDLTSLHVAPVTGGNPIRALDMRDVVEGFTYLFDIWSPSGSELVYISGVRSQSGKASPVGCWEVDIDAKTARLVAENISDLRIIDGDIAAFSADSSRTLSVSRWDTKTRTLVGPRVAVAGGLGGVATWAVSEAGVIAYTENTAAATSRLMELRDGVVRPVSDLRRDFAGQVRLSPDGSALATVIQTDTGPQVHVFDLAAGSLRLASPPDQFAMAPAWTPSGKLTYTVFRAFSDQELVVSGWPDAPGEVSPLMPGYEGAFFAPVSFDPDETIAVFAPPRDDTLDGDLVAVQLADGATTRLLATEAKEDLPTISPNGRWLAYRYQSGGQSRIEVRAFDAEGPSIGNQAWPLHGPSSFAPFWSRDGRTLYWRTWDDESLWGAEVISDSASDEIEFGPARVIVDQEESPFEVGYSDRPIEPTLDGEGFYLLEARGDNEPPGYVNLILNWQQTLRERLQR
ncbi:MAG: protein kinase [Planctomycetota bacterium]